MTMLLLLVRHARRNNGDNMNGIRKNRNELRDIFGTGYLRQLLQKGDMSEKEIQMVIDAVSEKYHF